MALEVQSDGSSVAGPVRSVVHETFSSLASVFRNRSLRRMQLALAGSMIGDWAYCHRCRRLGLLGGWGPGGRVCSRRGGWW